jgi:subtilisin family serine protease
MHRTARTLAVATLAAAAVFGLRVSPAASAQPIKTTYIVVLDDATTAAQDLAGRTGVTADLVYVNAFNGYAASLTSTQAAAIRGSAHVVSVQADHGQRMIDVTQPTVFSPSSKVPPQPAQVTTFGFDRVGGVVSPTLHFDGVEDPMPVNIAIVDTGIDNKHPDLDVRGGKSCVNAPGGSTNGDLFFHGTFVAGVAAARDNAIGRVGSAPGARLYAVRVADANGFIYESSLLCGIDWVSDHSRHIAVANVSIVGDAVGDTGNCGVAATGEIVDVLHYAICRSVAKGVTYVVAAGNDSVDAATEIPAAYDEVITVSGFADNDGIPGGLGGRLGCLPPDYPSQFDDQFAFFSNFGADIDLAAPAVCVGSLYPGGLYARDSGTSYAAPMVAGAAALYIVKHPGATPAQVRAALIAMAEPGPIPGDPDSFPEGIVNLRPL